MTGVCLGLNFPFYSDEYALPGLSKGIYDEIDLTLDFETPRMLF